MTRSPSDMASSSDFGSRLRQARTRKGVSLREIAVKTKISVSALEALERNDISRLPGGIFSRAWTVTTGTTYIDLQVTVSWSEDGVNKSVVVYGRRGL